jgi:cytosine/adenosine deaminase-related metal-dependent hydrolase
MDRQTGDLLVGNERIAAISSAIETSDAETMPPHRTTAKADEKISISCREGSAWATVNGAKMVGLDDRVGSLAVGKQADIVLLRKDDLNIPGARSAFVVGDAGGYIEC